MRPRRARAAPPGPSWPCAACARWGHGPDARNSFAALSFLTSYRGGRPRWPRASTRRSPRSHGRFAPATRREALRGVPRRGVVALFCAAFPTDRPALKRIRGTPSGSTPADSTSWMRGDARLGGLGKRCAVCNVISLGLRSLRCPAA